MDINYIVSAGLFALAIVLIINWVMRFLKSRIKKQWLENYEFVELRLLRFPGDISIIRERLEKGTKERELLKPLNILKKRIVVVGEFMNSMNFLRNENFENLNKLFLNAKQDIKKLEEQIEGKSHGH